MRESFEWFCVLNDRKDNQKRRECSYSNDQVSRQAMSGRTKMDDQKSDPDQGEEHLANDRELQVYDEARNGGYRIDPEESHESKGNNFSSNAPHRQKIVN